jgi:response regulator RpfG family c-di-GMP phosphodiesterase
MAQVLIVDDEVEICKYLRKLLSRKGFTTNEAHNGKEALGIIKSRPPEVVLLDIRMPVMDGIEALRAVKRDFPDTEVIMATGIPDVRIAIECMKIGASGYLMKPFESDSLLLEIQKAIEHRDMVLQKRVCDEILEKKMSVKSQQTQLLYANLQDSFSQSVKMFVDCLELYDEFLGGHSKRVAILCRKLGESFHMGFRRIADLEIAGLLHDIGKLGIPEQVLNTPYSELCESEIELIKKQTILSQNVLAPTARFTNPGKIIRNHLERFDGEGFPDGLGGDKIPLESKILCVANAYDEMKQRNRFNSEDEQNIKNSGEVEVDHLLDETRKKYDPMVVKRLLDVLKCEAMAGRDIEAITMERLKPGMVLAENMLSEKGKLLVGAPIQLSPLLISKIKNYHLRGRTVPGKMYVYR